MKDNLVALERAVDNLIQKDKNFSSVDAKDILYAFKAMAGRLSDAFDTLADETHGLNISRDDHEEQLKRLHHRSMALIHDVKRVEEKIDNLSTLILKNLKHIEVKGAEEDELE